MADPAFDPEKAAVVGERKPGAPRKLTEARRNALLELFADGVYRKLACASLGISTQTLRNEIKRDPEFKAAVHRSENAGAIKASKCVTDAAADDPKIALEYLARRHPEAWAKRKPDKVFPGQQAGGREAREALIRKLGGLDDPAPTKPDEPPPAAPPAPAGE